MSVEAIIRTKDIKMSFGKTEALRGITLTVTKGEILAIMGPSGSGKSTLLHALAAIIPPDSGEIYFGERRLDTLNDTQRTLLRRTAFGFVFQSSQLVPELTALDNVAVPLLLNGESKRSAYQQARIWLENVGLQEQVDTLPGELSGGEAQRVAIARAMVVQPKILFADEPTGSLDSLNSERIMELFITTVKKQGTTVIMVTHEPSIAAYADREIVVRDGQILGTNKHAR